MLTASILRGWDGHTWIYRGSIIKLSLNNYLRFDSCKITHYNLEKFDQIEGHFHLRTLIQGI